MTDTTDTTNEMIGLTDGIIPGETKAKALFLVLASLTIRLLVILFDPFYWCVVLVYCISLFLIALAVWVVCEERRHTTMTNKFVRYIVYVCVIGALIMCALKLNKINEAVTVSDEVVYVAYSPNHCRVADKPVRLAASVRNLSNSSPMYFVNLDKDTPASRELAKYISKKDSIIVYRRDKVTSFTRTLKQPSNESIKSPRFFYNQLHKFDKLVDEKGCSCK